MKHYAKRILIAFLSVTFLTESLSLLSIRVGSSDELVSPEWVLAQSNLTYMVDRLTDAAPTSGGQGSGLTGDLRYAITHAQSGDSITFNVTGIIKLSRALPIFARDISIQGTDGLAVHGGGGSVFSVGGDASVILSNLNITGGTGNGGGILNSGTLTLNTVTVSGNRTGDQTNGGGTGAGIWNNTNGTLILNNSTVSGNTVLGNASYSPSRGGGIANYGTLTLNNSTVSGNSAFEGFGGGISNTLPTSILILNNSTISDNNASGVIGVGSGIDNHGMLYASNTIIANNTDDDLRGVLSSQGHNLIGNSKGGSGFRADLGDLLDVNPMLGLLNNNGGLTQTQALMVGSPAIDQGDNTNCLQIDQRGYSRPGDGDKNGIAVCDMGAYEFDSVPPASTTTSGPADTFTHTLTSAPVSTDTSTDTFTPALAFTYTPTIGVPSSTPPPTPTLTPIPPLPSCSGAAILAIAIALLMRRRL